MLVAISLLLFVMVLDRPGEEVLSLRFLTRSTTELIFANKTCDSLLGRPIVTWSTHKLTAA